MTNVIFANGEFYHIFNRSIEQRPIFTSYWEFLRAEKTLDFYRFKNRSLSLAKALLLEKEEKKIFFLNLKRNENKLVEIICYCLMTNHFHFLLRQKINQGISKFLSNFTNSYTRYFNTRHKRIGPLFQGVFKAVRIETEEQLIHVSRYIHLNPVASFVVKEEGLDNYTWFSLPEYLGKRNQEEFCDKKIILDLFASREAYQQFVHNRIEYAQKLESIKHLVLD